MHQDTVNSSDANAGVIEVIRPAAVVPDEAARSILVELSLRSVYDSGPWLAQPSCWDRYDQPWVGPNNPGAAQLLGSIQVAYGTPTKYEITIYKVVITHRGAELGWSVQRLCDEALGLGDLSLAMCPRARLNAPPKPFRF